MNLKELYTGNRTYRKFRQESIPEEDLKSIMENVRLSHCGNNRQKSHGVFSDGTMPQRAMLAGQRGAALRQRTPR